MLGLALLLLALAAVPAPVEPGRITRLIVMHRAQVGAVGASALLGAGIILILVGMR